MMPKALWLSPRPPFRAAPPRLSRLATPHRSSDVIADELSDADRERLVDSHRILSREDAERVLEELPQQLEPTDGGA